MTGDLVTITIRRSHLWIAAALIVGFGLGYAVATSRAAASRVAPAVATAAAGRATAPSFVDVDVRGRPMEGPPTAAVTLVEFTDYQCPYCARHFRQLHDSLMSASGGRVRYVVRNFPVSSIHPYAEKAAEAAQCAADQGKFWEYHRALFERSPKLPLDTLERIAAALGLDKSRFERCLVSGAKAWVVARDVEDARRYGVIGTPTFFLNGRALVGAQPLSVLQAGIALAADSR